MQRSTLCRSRLAAVLVALLTLAGCGGAGSTPENQAADAPAESAADTPTSPQGRPAGDDAGAAAGPPAQGPVAAPAQGPRAVHVSMVDIAFEPDRIDIVAGQPVALTVTNDGQLEHDFDLPAAGVHVHGPPGARETTMLQIDEPGTYEALCLFPGHAEAGMRLEVIVT